MVVKAVSKWTSLFRLDNDSYYFIFTYLVSKLTRDLTHGFPYTVTWSGKVLLFQVNLLFIQMLKYHINHKNTFKRLISVSPQPIKIIISTFET